MMSVVTGEPQVEQDDLEAIPVLPSEPVPRREVLLRAAELVDEHGYVSCKLGGPGVGFCLLGAVHEAGVELGYVPRREAGEETTRLYVWAEHLVGVPAFWAYGWSDMLERDFSWGQTDAPAREQLSEGLRLLAEGMPWEVVTRSR